MRGQRGRGRRNYALAVSLIAGLTACHNQLDFGGATGSGGGGGRVVLGTGGMGTGGTGGSALGTGGDAGSCAGDAECRLSSLHCDVMGSKSCVACLGDANCTSSISSPHCDVSLHRCVACVTSKDCSVAQICLVNRCMTTCTESTPSTCPAGTSCDNGVCISCAEDGLACMGAGGTPYCLSPPRICVACRTDMDCGASTPFCDPVRHACVACTKGGQCPSATPFCDPAAGRCSAG